ncbi:MAG: AmmeMemoRadiSam system protein B [Rubrivivax sp.]
MLFKVRNAAVAGSFYPAGAAALSAAVRAHLATAPQPGDAPLAPPKLLVVPHAGYAYSGDSAARAYARLASLKGRVRRVVLLGPSHRVSLRGLALPAAQAFETPLGRVAVDVDASARVALLPQVQVNERAHEQEHALEVQLPFLQVLLDGGWCLVPLVVGLATPTEVAEVVEALWGGDETLVVVSSDLSHYHTDGEARTLDRRTVDRLLAYADDLRGEDACGAAALNGALRVARRHGLEPELLDLRTSADSHWGDRERVVGYASIAFAPHAATAPAPADDAALGHALLAAARAEISGEFGFAAAPVPAHPRLKGLGATFVTLRDAAGRLRGCVGHLKADRALIDDVRHNAAAAAFGDGRFVPVSAQELGGLRIEVSLLSALEPLPPAATLDDAARLLRPGVDGVLLEHHGQRGTLLPQVWKSLPDPHAFLRALLAKAALPGDRWPIGCHLSRYTVTAWEEEHAPAS